MRINLTTFLTSTATKITNDDDHSTTENSGSASSDSREQLQQVIVGLSDIQSLLYEAEEDHRTELFSAITCWL